MLIAQCTAETFGGLKSEDLPGSEDFWLLAYGGAS